jgi:transposase
MPASSIPDLPEALLLSLGPRERLALEDVLRQRDQRIAALELQVRLREEQLRMVLIKKYGPKGESLGKDQALLLDLEPGVQEAEVALEAGLALVDKTLPEAALLQQEQASRHNKKTKPGTPRYATVHPGRHELPAHLPRVEVIVPCQEAAGGELVGYETKEELVIKPAEFFVRVLKREKRVIQLGDRRTVATAASPGRIVDKGQLANETVVELVVRKYADYLPVYRQLQGWERDHSVTVRQATATRAVMAAGALLQPLARAIGQELRQGPLIQADETRLPVLQDLGKGRNDVAWLWQYSIPGGLVYFEYQDNRAQAGARAYLKDYGGILQSDGYVVYDCLQGQEQRHAGCFAHVRRKFVEACQAAPKEVPCEPGLAVVASIGELYGIEERAKGLCLKGPARLEYRQQEELVEKLTQLKAQIVEVRAKALLPKSLLARACDYALNQWEKLEVYAYHGEVEIDNNWCENAMRPVALGRKNWLHLGSHESGPKVAAIMTVLASAQRLGLNVRDYLQDILERMCDPVGFNITRLGELLPGRWQPTSVSRLEHGP